jgi:hypothetical protein
VIAKFAKLFLIIVGDDRIHLDNTDTYNNWRQLNIMFDRVFDGAANVKDSLDRVFLGVLFVFLMGLDFDINT